MTSERLESLTRKIPMTKGGCISRKDAVELAAGSGEVMDLFMCAHRIRQQYKGEKAFTCSIINAKSGRCSEDCAFCAQSAHHKTSAATYPMLDEQRLVEGALHCAEAGATRYSMVTSGYMLKEEEIDTIIKATAIIKAKTDLEVCASLGVLTESIARRLKEGRITTYHHNLETSRSYFPHVCTTHRYDEDVHTVEIAKASGLRVCCGGIFGLGETWEQRVELAFTLKELDVDSIPINFLNPIPGTKMEDKPLLSPMDALKCIALFRLINPGKDITICGGREKTLRDYQSWIFMAGANGVMIGDYLTTKGRNMDRDIKMIKDMGLEIIKE
jgi:biotin synthase